MSEAIIDALRRRYMESVGNPARQLIGGGVRGYLGLDAPAYADGLGMEAYRNAAAIGNTPVVGMPSMAVRAGAKAAPAVAESLRKHAKGFQEYNRALGPAGASQAIVWQGSPHKYDAEKLVRLPSGEQVYVGGKFNAIKEVPSGATVLQDFPLGRIRSEAIGTGEGAQAYGHGSYLAEARDVANTYAIPRGVPDVEGLAFERGLRLSRDARIELMRQSNSQRDAVEAAKMLQNASREARTLPVEKLADTIQAIRQAREPQLYKVDLPDEKIARMLDWDKPLSQQSDAVYNAMRKLYMDKTVSAPTTGPTGAAVLQAQQALGRQGATDYFRNAGIPGIRYLDEGSKGVGKDTSNFVVFPGEESALTILQRNDEIINALRKKKQD